MIKGKKIYNFPLPKHSISDIATVTQLTKENVRASLQEIVDLYNNINKMGNESYLPQTVETYFDLKKFKHNRNKEEKL
ncbi:hypothetical protein [Clostridium thailandense]|uniref:hypothetical protein n=1 Tax=Clostridium thailandense TaxID=2794346 RepID=UPI003989765A